MTHHGPRISVGGGLGGPLRNLLSEQDCAGEARARSGSLWHDLRREDLGPLWEHLVLNELHAHVGPGPIHYWRSKHGNEVDFVVARRGASAVAIECKWSADEFETAGLRAFRSRYPKGPNIVVAADVRTPYERRYGELGVRFVSLADLIDAIRAPRAVRR